MKHSPREKRKVHHKIKGKLLTSSSDEARSVISAGTPSTPTATKASMSPEKSNAVKLLKLLLFKMNGVAVLVASRLSLIDGEMPKK